MGHQTHVLFRGRVIEATVDFWILAELRVGLGLHPVNNQRRYRKLKF